MEQDKSKDRVDAGSKRVINGKTDVNQLVPFKYTGVWDGYIKANERHWMPAQFNFHSDILEFDLDRIGFEKHLARFIGMLSVTSGMFPSLGLAIYGAFSSPEHRQFMLRVNFEESVHNHLAMHLADEFGINLYKAHNDFLDLPEVAHWIAIRNNSYDYIYNNSSNLNCGGFVRHLFDSISQEWLISQHYTLELVKRVGGKSAYKSLNEAISRYVLDKKSHAGFYVGSCLTAMSEENYPVTEISKYRNDQAYRIYLEFNKDKSEHAIESYLGLVRTLTDKNVTTFKSAMEIYGTSLFINKAESSDTSSTAMHTVSSGQLDWD